MSMLINIALLTLGFIGTLAAFGGETWRQTDEPLLKRVTRRGWLSISCLVLALTLGVVKEISSSIAANEEAKNRETLQKQLEETRQNLIAANERLKGMSSIIEAVPRRTSSISVNVPPNSDRPLDAQLFGGDKVEYDSNCPNVSLVAGSKEYNLDINRPTLIVGAVNQPMPATILNKSGEYCSMKIHVYSAGRASR